MYELMKRTLYSTLGGTGLDLLLRPVLGGVGAILMLHRVWPEAPTTKFGPTRRLVVEEEAFRDVINHLRRWGYDIISLDEVRKRLAEGRTDRKFVSFTFDDGYLDNYEIAYPIAKALEIPITIYIATDMIEGRLLMWWFGLERIIAQSDIVDFSGNGSPVSIPTRTVQEKERAYNRLDAMLRLAGRDEQAAMIVELEKAYDISFSELSAGQAMSWSMIEELSCDELVEIGAHTVSHPALSTLSETEARREIADSREILKQRLSKPIRHFAYPFGRPKDAGEREFEICRDIGFDTAVTTHMAPLRSHHRDRMFSLPRFDLAPDNTVRSLRVVLGGVPSFLHAALPWVVRG